ncbi:MAG: hypothetical protein C0490_22220 [Marivirga sp.]|nr:hypothetical protein [Marivirga sp.]
MHLDNCFVSFSKLFFVETKVARGFTVGFVLKAELTLFKSSRLAGLTGYQSAPGKLTPSFSAAFGKQSRASHVDRRPNRPLDYFK